MDLIELSQTIRKLRMSRAMTVEQLAQRSGFSKGFISQIENFRVTPSLNSLNKISAALQIPLDELFSGTKPEPEFTFGKISEGCELIRNDNAKYGIHYFALACAQAGRSMDPFIIEYKPSASEREFMMHESEEFFLLLEGSVDFYVINDAGRHPMKAGDTVYLKKNLPHRVVLTKKCKYAKALIVYSALFSNNPERL